MPKFLLVYYLTLTVPIFSRCEAEGTKIHASMCKEEWDDHWNRFINREHRTNRDDSISRLMRRKGIRENDIRDYHLRRKKREKEQIAPSKDGEVSVIQTMTLLWALEQHMEHLQTKVTNFMSKAKYIVSTSGNADLLLDNQEFVDFLHEAKELVMKKLNSGQIPEKTVRSIADSVTLLLQKSSVKPTIANSSSLDISGYQDPLKLQIAETIINHFKELNRPLSQDILNGLVNSEFQRIQSTRQPQHFVPQPQGYPHPHQQRPYHAQPQPHPQRGPHHPQQVPQNAPPQLANEGTQLLSNINANWGDISNILQNVSTSNEVSGQSLSISASTSVASTSAVGKSCQLTVQKFRFIFCLASGNISLKAP